MELFIFGLVIALIIVVIDNLKKERKLPIQLLMTVTAK